MSAHDELLARLQALEQENGMLRQGVQQAARMRRLWEQAIDELQATKQQLELSNAQLATLHRINSAIYQTLDLDPLFDNILAAMESALVPAQGRAMGVFLIEEDRMRLVASRGADEAFVEAHKRMRVGECLCGLAASTCELIVSPECRKDTRHTLDYHCAESHGHVIVPLVSRGQALGVFYYYLPSGVEIDPRQQETFTAIGQQLGMAIEHARLYEETRSRSMQDALTGLGNRHRMERMLDCELTRVARYERPLSVLLIDIDFFKQYNDTHGHLAGDRLLTQIGAILNTETRGNDLAVRYGGEEFLLILPETPLPGALQMAERLRQKVAAQTPVTISIGAAAALPARAERDTLLQAADDALYQAKQAGRNRIGEAAERDR